MIGSGLVGATIANHLANAGRRVAIVDALKPAQAGTRRAVGIATPLMTPNYIADTVRGVDGITNLAMRLAVSPRACRVMHLATAPSDTEALQLAAASFKDKRPKVLWENKTDAVPTGFSGGMIVHNGVLLDLGLLTNRLLQHPYISVHDNIEIQSLDSSNNRLTALAHGHSICANAIVIATNAYAGSLSPYVGDSVQMARCVTWSSRPLDQNQPLLERMLQVVPLPLIIDDARMLMAPTLDWRLRIFARSIDNKHDPAADITAFLRARLPELTAETDEWRYGVTSITADHAPLVGRLASAGSGSVVYAVAAGMYGPAWATVMAERVLALVEV